MFWSRPPPAAADIPQPSRLSLWILSILLIANLINIAISLAMGWQDNISALLRHSLILAAINIPMLLAVTGWDLLSRRRWKQKQRRDDWDTEFQVLKCTPAAYQLLILPAALTAVIACISASVLLRSRMSCGLFGAAAS